MRTKRYHILIDVSGASNEILNNKEGLSTFLTELPKVINMHVLKGPLIASGIPENPGLSGFVIIDYSHISVHTFTKHNEALIDIFSCKPFITDKAVKFVLKYFQIEKQSTQLQKVSWG